MNVCEFIFLPRSKLERAQIPIIICIWRFYLNDSVRQVAITIMGYPVRRFTACKQQRYT